MVEYVTLVEDNLSTANAKGISQVNSVTNRLMIVLQVHAGMVEHVIQVEEDLPFVDVRMTMPATSVKKGMMPAHPIHAKMMESAFQKMTGQCSVNARKDSRANIVMTKTKVE